MTVTGCQDCPLFSEGCYCGHPDRPTGMVWEAAPDGTVGRETPHDKGFPAWCPLRTAPLTIALEQTAEEIEAAMAKVREAIMNADLGGGGEYYYHPRLGLIPAIVAESTGTYAGLDHRPLRDRVADMLDPKRRKG